MGNTPGSPIYEDKIMNLDLKLSLVTKGKEEPLIVPKKRLP